MPDPRPTPAPARPTGTAAPNAPGARALRRARRERVALLVVVAALVAAGVLISGVLDGPAYRVHARFANAGQLVTGGKVQVGGQQIGSIRRISITDQGQADVELEVTDDRFVPLRRGTHVAIRSVGQATITNRYLDVTPGPRNRAAIADGGVLPAATATAGIVDLDQILDAVDPPTRRRLQGLIANGAKIYAGSGAREFNDMLRTLSPTTRSVAELTRELAGDERQLQDLLRSGSVAASAVASRDTDLEAAVDDSARTFSAIATERRALVDVLDRAPAVLRRTSGTLERTAATTTRLRPALRRVAPVQPALQRLLRTVPPALDSARPALTDLAGLLRPTRTALAGLPPLRAPTVDALNATGAAFKDSNEILEGLRFYGSDFLLGVVNGLTGLASGGYNQFGHYVFAEFVQNPQTILSGALGGLLPSLTGGSGLLPGIFNVVRNQDARCPGSGEPPAPDGSSPWNPKPGICDPTQSMHPLVNSPTSFCFNAVSCTPGVGDRGKTPARAREDARARR